MDQTQQIPMIVIVGPTASGKTRLAVEVALRFHGEVVSADSMQIYRGMDIGTAKPSPEETRGVPHHMIDILSPGEPFSVADYVERAGKAVREIRGRGKIPVLAGGTGLYVNFLTQNITFGETARDDVLRERLRAQAAKSGGQPLLDRLSQIDPETAAQLHPNNLGRIIRALEVFETSGVTLSEWNRRSRSVPSPYRCCKLGLSFEDRAALYRRIDLRVDRMMEAGLADEAARLLKLPGVRGSTAMQAIGYKELARHFDGELPLADAVETIKRETRRYAKRQMTWFRRDGEIHWIEASKSEEIISDEAFGFIDKSGIL